MTAVSAFVSSFSLFRLRNFSDAGAVWWHPELGAKTVDFLAHDVTPGLQNTDVLLGALEAGFYGIEFAFEGVALGFDGAELIKTLFDLRLKIVDVRTTLLFFDACLPRLLLHGAELGGGLRELVTQARAFLFAQTRLFLRRVHGTLGGINASLCFLTDPQCL